MTEVIQLLTVNGVERLHITTTTTNETYVLDLAGQRIAAFADRSTTDLPTGLPVGGAYASADNLAVNHGGNIYNGRNSKRSRSSRRTRRSPEARRPGERLSRS